MHYDIDFEKPENGGIVGYSEPDMKLNFADKIEVYQNIFGVTMYNEPAKQLKQTLKGILENQRHYARIGQDWRRNLIIVIKDGYKPSDFFVDHF